MDEVVVVVVSVSALASPRFFRFLPTSSARVSNSAEFRRTFLSSSGMAFGWSVSTVALAPLAATASPSNPAPAPSSSTCIATVPACASPAGTRKCARCSAACTARGRTRIPTRSHRTSRAGSGPVPPPAQPPTRPRAMSRSPRSSRRRPRRRPVPLAPRALPPRRCIARIGRWRGRRSPRRRRLHPFPRVGDDALIVERLLRRPSVGAQTPRAPGEADANESPGQIC